ncbi:MAG: acylphosphatase [Bdellovibrionales bacterium]|nr:acylphosphatase [Bdellovibrionales bacterium]
MTCESPKASRFRVEGRVQGVGFRQFVSKHAELLGLVGWVQNKGDGSVEGVAQGEPSRLSRFLVELRVGPAASVVRGLHVEEITLDSALSSFSILPSHP